MPCPNVKKQKKNPDGVNIIHSGLFLSTSSSSYNRTIGKSSPPTPSQYKKKNVHLSCIIGKVLAPLAP